jgi:hypothetical protein
MMSMPVAWLRGHKTHTDHGIEYDEEVVPGSDCPLGEGWLALGPYDADAVSSDDLAALLPGPYYMDPPDGGSVSLHEQLKKMSEDARRYRWLRNSIVKRKSFDGLPVIVSFHSGCNYTHGSDPCDKAIDEAMEKYP